MSSPGFTGGGGGSDFYGGAPSFSGRSITLPSNMNNNNNNNLTNPFYRTQQQQIPSIFLDPSSQISQRQNIIGKRTLAEFQTQNINNNNNLNLHNFNNNHHNNNTVLSNLLLRSVKPRNFQHGSPMSPLSPMDFTNSPPEFTNNFSFSSPRLGLPIRSNPLPMNNSILQNTNFLYQSSNFSQIQNRETTTSHDPHKKMMDHRLLELEKELLEDNDEGEGEDTNSVITNNEWSETIQNLIDFGQNPTQKPVSSSPTSSTTSLNSSSSSIVSPASGCSKQLLIEAATAISDGKTEAASEILARLGQTQNLTVNSDRRLTDCMVSALKSRVNPVENPPPVAELFSKEHGESTQLLFNHLLCFKVSLMAANIAILEAAFDETIENANPTTTNNNNNAKKLCVVDFDIGQGKQYVSLLHELHARLNGSPATVKIMVVAENGEEDRLKTVGENLARQAERLRIGFEFKVVNNLKLDELTRESLCCDSDEFLAVNFAFKLYNMPDESVSTENPRDALLRRVKSLAPNIVTLVEQEMNTNTAPFVARVVESCSYYGALFDSIESTMGKESLERVKIEEGLSRKMGNSVACEGRDRVERCEVFGKWRARMSMAGFKSWFSKPDRSLNPLSQKVAESIKARLAPGSRVTVNEENGGVYFGWMGKSLTVTSAWR